MKKVYSLPLSDEEKAEVVELVMSSMLDRIADSMGSSVCIAGDVNKKKLSCRELIAHMATVSDELSKPELRELFVLMATANVVHGNWECLYPVAEALRIERVFPF